MREGFDVDSFWNIRCGAKKRTVNSNSHRFFVYCSIFDFNIILESLFYEKNRQK